MSGEDIYGITKFSKLPEFWTGLTGLGTWRILTRKHEIMKYMKETKYVSRKFLGGIRIK
jgi:hypothetical protein